MTTSCAAPLPLRPCPKQAREGSSHNDIALPAVHNWSTPSADLLRDQ